MNEDKCNINVLDILLSAKPQKLPQKQVKIKRLSKLLGADVVFKLGGISYNRVAEIRDLGDDAAIYIVLAGVLEPDFKDSRLLNKYSAMTPAELLKNPEFLLPGEVEDLSREIEKLSGYKTITFEDIEKN